MKRIIVPTDFSDVSSNAFQIALQIAKITKADILLWHLVESPPDYVFEVQGSDIVNKFIEVRYNAAEKDMEIFMSQLADAPVDLESEVVKGRVSDALALSIAHFNADLVIVGTQGTPASIDDLDNAMTEKIVRHATCPVLTVLPSIKKFEMKKVVAATLLDEGHEMIWEKLLPLRQFFHFDLQFLYINTPDNFMTNQEIEEIHSSLSKKTGINVPLKIYADVDEETGICNYAEESKQDLIVLASHQRRGTAYLFAGSTTEEVINRANTAVLSFGLHCPS